MRLVGAKVDFNKTKQLSSNGSNKSHSRILSNPVGVNSALSNMSGNPLYVGAKDLTRVADNDFTYFE